jgi:hypothetical protein
VRSIRISSAMLAFEGHGAILGPSSAHAFPAPLPAAPWSIQTAHFIVKDNDGPMWSNS